MDNPAPPATAQEIDTLLEYALALQNSNDLQAAMNAYQAVLAENPSEVRALGQIGFVYARMGRFAEALVHYTKARALQPPTAQLLSDLGVAFVHFKRFDEALTCYDEALALQPTMAPIHLNRGTLLKDMKRYDEALMSYGHAIALQPDIAQFHYHRATVLKELNRFDEALASYERAIALKPDYALAHMHRGLVLNRLQRFDEALASCEQALALNPNHGETLNNHGLALLGLRRYAEALVSFERAIALHPNSFEARANHGGVLSAMGRFAEAVEDYNKALRIRPDAAEAYANRGLAHLGLLHFDAALNDYDRAIKLKPDYDYIHASRGLIHLMRGDFEKGWKLFEWRWKIPSTAKYKRAIAAPLWLGDEPLAGKTIFIHPEQGFGDFIQFCRYVPMLEAMGATVLLETPRTLQALMTTLSPTTTLIPGGSPVPDCDFYCPIMSLPLAFKTTLATIPAPTPYLAADPEKCKAWDKNLGPKRLPRVGLVWAGSPIHPNDFTRSVAFSHLAPLLQLPAEFHCLQKEVSAADRSAVASHSNLHLHDAALHDFSDTAALVEAMDLVITIDTSVAHLAGALGKPTWILIQSPPDYRWLLDRDDSPWYPTARLFRQPQSGDWASVIGQLGPCLEQQIAVGGVAP